MDLKSVELFVGGLSAAASIFFLTAIEEYISSHMKIHSHPLLDSIGIIIGTIIVIFVYNIFLKSKNASEKRHKIGQR
jgi:hypothetical protein